ncbi:hypothetical protein AKJ62_03330 [candidate division MSBL1 archaeon SCGC-AAA259D14]|uniref:Amidohydrolase 3 domain-containing protein n=1 Tax=candidate division MSBL1 archaeon SCGC-AAA259D14 TaxID=1698261 RepID=A0A133U574_9EURY|nr:hypothetical protein AKJ62_03330 [candidate division MSBL1 archaeon SCGC-AAA259D14]
MDLLIKNTHIFDDKDKKDIGIENGKISEIGSVKGEAKKIIDVDGRLIYSCFIDPHIHLDKVLIADDLPSNKSGTLKEAIELIWDRKKKYTVEDVKKRAKKVMEKGISNGTLKMRTSVDVDTIGGLTPLEGVLAAREEMKNELDLEIVAFPQEGIVRDPGTEDLMREAMKKGADLVGGMPHYEKSQSDAEEHVNIVFDIANKFGVDIDMHVDETDDPDSRTLEIVADKTIEEGYEGRVTAAHTCALAAYPDDYAKKVIERVKEANIHMVTNPVTNLVVQGREDKQPIRRGITRVKELLKAGINVSFGQDCVKDAFYPFGQADMLEVALITAHTAQLTMPDEIKTVFRMMTDNAAKILGIEDNYGVGVGKPADLVVVDAPTAAEAIRLHPPKRWVVRKGRLVSSPD